MRFFLKKTFNALKQILISLALFFVLIICLETGLRLFGFVPAGVRRFSPEFAAPDSLLGFKAYGNASWYFDTTPGGGPVLRKFGTTNASGYRPSLENADCSLCHYIVVVGDSFTFSPAAANRETWPELLSKHLSLAGKKFKIINISFQGWSTLQSELALRTTNFSGKKIDYILYLTSPNDVRENIKAIYGHPAPIATEVNGQFKIVLANPEATVSKIFNSWNIESFARKYSLTTLIYSLSVQKLVGANNSHDFISTNSGDYKTFWRQGLLDKALDLINLLTGKSKEASLAHAAFNYGVRGMAKTSYGLGAKFIMIPLPFGPYTHGNNAEKFSELLGVSKEKIYTFLKAWKKYNTELRQISERNNVVFLKINLDMFSGLGFKDYAARPEDWHFSARANELFAQEISAKLLKQMRE